MKKYPKEKLWCPYCHKIMVEDADNISEKEKYLRCPYCMLDSPNPYNKKEEEK